MTSDYNDSSMAYDHDLLQEAILHIRAKEYDLARPYLERALASAEASDDLETRAQASYYLSEITVDPRQKRQLLEDTLAIDPAHAEARRSLAILDGKLKPGEIVDPDAPHAPAAGETAVQVDRFTCPRCGGRMTYAPDGHSLVCENCERTQRLSTAPSAKEEDFFIAMANGTGLRAPVSMQTFQCQGCGARFVLAPQELSARCAYCGSDHVVATGERRDLLEPDSIIPMAFDQKQAALHLAQWLEDKKILPQGDVSSPGGLYLPVWAFDLIGSLPWNGRVYRNKREVPVSGERPVQVNSLCVPAATKLAEGLKKLLPEYILASAPAYDPRFLAGWPAEIYDLSMADASLEARRMAVEQARSSIQVEGGGVIDLSYSTSAISVTAFRLILLPVWVVGYSLDSHPFQVLINGQTGAVYGEAPERGLKQWLGGLVKG
jgi:tetratricopeptide (TPR) repeat protein